MKAGNAAGFTLMEVLVAVTVFAIGILAAAAMQVAAIKTNATARLINEATVVAAQRAEVLLDRPYSHVDLRQLEPGQPLPEVDGNNVKTTWQVRENFPELDTKTVTITVAGMDRGIRKTVVVERIIALGAR
jgi:prepilin-type N-terminal cleavage/methylation domain-containing protein